MVSRFFNLYAFVRVVWTRTNESMIIDSDPTDNLRYTLSFDLGKYRKKKRNSPKEPFKSSKIPKFGRGAVKYRKYIALYKVCKFSILLYYAWKFATILEQKVVAIIACNTII